MKIVIIAFGLGGGPWLGNMPRRRGVYGKVCVDVPPMQIYGGVWDLILMGAVIVKHSACIYEVDVNARCSKTSLLANLLFSA